MRKSCKCHTRYIHSGAYYVGAQITLRGLSRPPPPRNFSYYHIKKVFLYICIHTHLYIHIHIFIYACYIYTHTPIYTHTYIYIRMYIYVYIYLYKENHKGETKSKIKHPKDIHSLHQEDTVNIGYE